MMGSSYVCCGVVWQSSLITMKIILCFFVASCATLLAAVASKVCPAQRGRFTGAHRCGLPFDVPSPLMYYLLSLQILSTSFYKSTHFKKLQAALDKEFRLKVQRFWSKPSCMYNNMPPACVEHAVSRMCLSKALL
eukprot:scaffold653002_cov60-Prasinocladus_malaysianus.AAC.1